MAGLSVLIPLPQRPPCSPYCDHTKGDIGVTQHPVLPGANSSYDYTCSKCDKKYEYEVVSGKWFELDSQAKRVV